MQVKPRLTELAIVIAVKVSAGICSARWTIIKPRLHVGHFTLTANTTLHPTTLLSDVVGIVKPECCTCGQGQVLQQN